MAPAAATSLGPSDDASEDDQPCVIIRTDPPSVTVADKCSSGGIAMIDDMEIP